MLTTFMGLPMPQFFPQGLHYVQSLTALNVTYAPCYLMVANVRNDPNHTKVIAYGHQTHCLKNIDNEPEPTSTPNRYVRETEFRMRPSSACWAGDISEQDWVEMNKS